MKRLTRKSLDELAKSMSVINKEEQIKSVGGHLYYTQDGTYLGSTPFGNEIRITTLEAFQQMMNSPDLDQYSSIGNGLSNSSYFIQQSVINGIGSEMGISNVDLFNSSTGPYGVSTVFGPIGLNQNSPYYSSNNYYDIYLTLLHEKQHKDTPEDAGTAKSELEAYEAVINHPYFEMASPEFRNAVYINYLQYSKDSLYEK